MGLSIHYQLKTKARGPTKVRGLVSQLRQWALDLPFQEVSDLVERSGADTDFDRCQQDDPFRWLLIQSSDFVEETARDGGFYHYRVAPTHVIAFETLPGEGCEPANFGLCRYSTADGKAEWKNVSPSRPQTIRPDRWSIGTVVRVGDRRNQTQLLVDGIRSDEGTAIPYHPMNSERGFIGCLRSETGCWKGGIAEILIYGDALSEDDCRAVERYLQQKYSLGDGK